MTRQQKPETTAQSGNEIKAKAIASQTITLDGPDWTIATDPHDKGRDEKWFEAPRPEAQPATVPCTIQEIFPSYAGLAWYWKAFEAPKNPHPGGRYLLRFWMVDYKADVWVNGKLVGSHEIADEPFVLDATEAVRAGTNVLAVRVLHPTATGMDGLVQQETPNGVKGGLPGSDWNFGGILDAVELLVAPAVRIEDLYADGDWKSGDVKVQVNVRNSGSGKVRVRLALSVAPAVGGERIAEVVQEQEVPAGDTLVTGTIHVPQHRRLLPCLPIGQRGSANTG
ncbi:MAG: sugar-binding domain-containing protein, partial [Kiritimatiellia bacterium]